MNRGLLRSAVLVLVSAVLAFEAGCASVRPLFLDTSDHFPVAYEFKKVPDARGAVLLLHGLGTNLDEWYTFSKDLRREGWTTMAVDLRGHGESIQFGGEEVLWAQMTPEGRRSSLNDAAAAVHYLKTHAPEAEENLWIVGSSFGSSLALLYASEHPGVRGIVLLSPGLFYGGIQTEEAARHYRSGAVLLAAAEDNPGAPREAQNLFDWIPSPDKKLFIRPKGGHGSQMLDEAEGLKKEVLEWLKQEPLKTQKTISV